MARERAERSGQGGLDDTRAQAQAHTQLTDAHRAPSPATATLRDDARTDSPVGARLPAGHVRRARYRLLRQGHSILGGLERHLFPHHLAHQRNRCTALSRTRPASRLKRVRSPQQVNRLAISPE